jgi:hypothetical protein
MNNAQLRQSAARRAAARQLIALPGHLRPTSNRFDQSSRLAKRNVEEGPMRKTILAIAATAIIGAVAFKPVPAAAFFWVPIVMEAKKDKNFKAVNPYTPVKARNAKKRR